jgi:hypothetical protein
VAKLAGAPRIPAAGVELHTRLGDRRAPGEPRYTVLKMNPRHHSVTVSVAGPPADVFAFLDEHARLAAHMGKKSLAMGGGSMALELDEGRGRVVGSRMRLAGTAFGIHLSVDEAVTEHSPPSRKSWETVGDPRLLVIGAYRMGFTIGDDPPGSRLTVYIDYELPRHAPSRWLGLLLGHAYARWCTERMASDAARHFAEQSRREYPPGPGNYRKEG